MAVGPQTDLVCGVRGQTAADEDQGRTSEEEDAGGDSNYDRQVNLDKTGIDGNVFHS